MDEYGKRVEYDLPKEHVSLPEEYLSSNGKEMFGNKEFNFLPEEYARKDENKEKNQKSQNRKGLLRKMGYLLASTVAVVSLSQTLEPVKEIEVAKEEQIQFTEPHPDSIEIKMDGSEETQEPMKEKPDLRGISEKYVWLGKGNRGVIPARNEEGKYGLITYEDQILVPFIFDSACVEVNDEGQSFFQNDTGSYVFDKNGKELFYTEHRIQSVKDGIIFAFEGNTFDVSYAYYTIDGESLFETHSEEGYEYDDWATGFSEGYAFFGGSRMNADGNIESMTDVLYGDQNSRQDSGDSRGIIADVAGISFYGGIPVSALNQGFYLSRSEVIITDSYGIYYIHDANHRVFYSFDFSSLFNHKGVSFSKSDSDWGFHSYFDDGCTYYNYGTIICPYTYIDGEVTYYLVDCAKVVENPEEYVNPGEYWSEDIWDYDYMLLTEEALLFEADQILFSNEKYWLVNKDGQWGYIDHAGNIMEMYEDAAEFNNGKAVVIEDGVAYVIDETFAKIEEFGPALYVENHGELFKVVTNDNYYGKMIALN